MIYKCYLKKIKKHNYNEEGISFYNVKNIKLNKIIKKILRVKFSFQLIKKINFK